MEQIEIEDKQDQGMADSKEQKTRIIGAWRIRRNKRKPGSGHGEQL
jgi:hypothetical protein